MKFPLISRKRYEKEISNIRKQHIQEIEEVSVKVKRQTEKESMSRVQARWDHGLNLDGSREEINFKHLGL